MVCSFICPFLAYSTHGGEGIYQEEGLLRWAPPHKTCCPIVSERYFDTIDTFLVGDSSGYSLGAPGTPGEFFWSFQDEVSFRILKKRLIIDNDSMNCEQEGKKHKQFKSFICCSLRFARCSVFVPQFPGLALLCERLDIICVFLRFARCIVFYCFAACCPPPAAG